MLQSVMHWQDFLKRHLDDRQRRNPSYSLRAFARDLGMSPSRISELLSAEDAPVSAASAEAMAVKLGYQDDELRFLVDLAVRVSSKSPLQRELAASRIQQFQGGESYRRLTTQQFALINRWYHFAILELVKFPNFSADAGWIAAQLDISREQVLEALARLETIGLLYFEDEHLVVAQRRNVVSSSTPAESIQDFHRQMLTLAEKALPSQDLEERDFSAVITAFSSSENAAYKKLLLESRRNLIDEAKRMSPEPDSVYALCVQWFRLSKHEPDC